MSFGTLDLAVPFGYGLRDTHEVGFLEGVGAQQREPTCPVTSTSGVESISASASPVTVFVAPGPEVTRQTPTRPLTRA